MDKIVFSSNTQEFFNSLNDFLKSDTSTAWKNDNFFLTDIKVDNEKFKKFVRNMEPSTPFLDMVVKRFLSEINSPIKIKDLKNTQKDALRDLAILKYNEEVDLIKKYQGFADEYVRDN